MRVSQKHSKKTLIALTTVVAAAVGLSTFVVAQVYTPGYVPASPAQPMDPVPPGYPEPQVQVQASPQVPQLSEAEIADLTASIALYPDPLLAAIFPAATYPLEVASANQWLAANPAPDELAIQALPYQPSVKTIMHYPTVLSLMADHLDWTQALGAAVVYQQADVMNSIQQWRATAISYGALATTQQQEITTTGPIIEILPVTPDVIYVPVYDPQVVYVRQPGPYRDAIHFDVAGRFGGWLDFDLDWSDRVVLVPSQPYWVRHEDDRQRWDEIHRPPVIVANAGRPGAPQGAGQPRNAPAPAASRAAFVRTGNDRPTFPDRVVAPQPDKKVVTIRGGSKPAAAVPQARGRGDVAPAAGPAAARGRSDELPAAGPAAARGRSNESSAAEPAAARGRDNMLPPTGPAAAARGRGDAAPPSGPAAARGRGEASPSTAPAAARGRGDGSPPAGPAAARGRGDASPAEGRGDARGPADRGGDPGRGDQADNH